MGRHALLQFVYMLIPFTIAKADLCNFTSVLVILTLISYSLVFELKILVAVCGDIIIRTLFL